MDIPLQGLQGPKEVCLVILKKKIKSAYLLGVPTLPILRLLWDLAESFLSATRQILEAENYLWKMTSACAGQAERGNLQSAGRGWDVDAQRKAKKATTTPGW